MKTTVGIIGTGRFAQTLEDAFNKLPNEWEVNIAGRNSPESKKKKVYSSEIVIPAVPISSFESVIKDISSVISKDSLVVDVCSVSIYPEKVLIKYLNNTVDILSTHPMFGPDSTQNGKTFDNLKFVYHSSRIKNKIRLKKFLNHWNYIGCDLIEMTPHEHDSKAAYTHAYAFLIGKLGIKMKVRNQKFSTKGFECLMYNQKAVENDSSQLFDDMFRFNPYTKRMVFQLKKELQNIEQALYS